MSKRRLYPHADIIVVFPGTVIQEEKTPLKEEPSDSTARPFNYDVVDVSKGFITRIPYKKKVKPSKLDGLLERRLKQHIIEERQRQRISISSNPHTPKSMATAPTLILTTPVRPASTLIPTQLVLGSAVKSEGEGPSNSKGSSSEDQRVPVVQGTNGAELPKTPESATPLVASPAPASTVKDNRCARVDNDSTSPRSKISSTPGELEAHLVERTTGPLGNNSGNLGQEGVKVPEAEGTSAEGACQAGMEDLKSENDRASVEVSGQESSQDTSSSRTAHQKTETLTSGHSGTEENGTGPAENAGDGQGGSAGDSTLGMLHPLPQVNGNDSLGSDGAGSNSVSSDNCVVSNSLQPRASSVSKASDEDGEQQRPLVNGALEPVKDGKEFGSKALVDSKTSSPDLDYMPPVKILRVDNNIELIGPDPHITRQHNETKASPAVKIIRMPPSPIPSAEESSMSDDFAEEGCGATESSKTMLTQVTTTSTTTATTTVVSTEVRVVKSPVNTEATATSTVSTAESSAVSTLTTMTKTTVTKVCSSGPDGHSEVSRSEVVTQEQRTAMAATAASKSVTSGPGGVATVSSVALLSQEDVSSTKGRVRLLKFSRTKKTRSDTALPSYCKFVTKSNRKSIFVLQHEDLKVLGRRGGFREVPIFSYNAKPAWDIWPYPSPRPTFGITWR